jgi:2-keto-4-pentenoate hydratase/2-oxohepta-3-ene-1,7-dioic acid hydratase in catechol pathway
MRRIVRLCTFQRNNNKFLGLLTGENKVIDISRTSEAAHMGRYTDMLSLVADNASDETVMRLAELVKAPPAESLLALGPDCRLLAPITRPPRNVFCVGKNYLDHVQEIQTKSGSDTPAELPKYAMFFTKAPECVIAPGDGIPAHAEITKWLDYEVELGVVIGKAGKNITKENALEHVFGWTIGNDISARDLQKRHTQFFKGKTLDGSCPMGPCIVPRQFLAADDLGLKLWVNGELRQNGRTSSMIFDVPSIIEQLSAGFTLLPGDVILTGTPAGVGYAMVPPQMLKAGDSVRLEIEEIGVLENTVI